LEQKRLAWQDYLPSAIQKLYEIRDYHHAATILANEFPGEFNDVCKALIGFSITTADILAKGGNESAIPKKFSAILRPLEWKEEKLQANLMVDEKTIRSDTHRIDYVKGRVALDVEWNSKDQTFDRDLYAFRTFFEFGKISVAVLITRSGQLDEVFTKLRVMPKYGASTTHLGKLWPRLDASRHGGCPVLVFGITPASITDWKG
jgi:CRISPR-associated protein Csd2